MGGEAGPEARSKRPPGGRSISVVRNCGLIQKSLGFFYWKLGDRCHLQDIYRGCGWEVGG